MTARPCSAPREAAVLIEGFREWARVALASIDGLTTDERQRLSDVQRKDTRYGFGLVAELCAIARRSNDPAVYLGPAEVLRTVVLTSQAAPSLNQCEDEETRAQAETDLAQNALRRTHGRCPSVRHTLRQAALRESEWARRLADAVT